MNSSVDHSKGSTSVRVTLETPSHPFLSCLDCNFKSGSTAERRLLDPLFQYFAEDYCLAQTLLFY